MTEVNEKRVPWQDLKAFVRLFFVRNGCPEGDAEISADSIVQANLRGVDSHGVLLIPMYLRQFQEGRINPSPNIEVVRETPSTALIDADLSYGPIVSVRAMRMAIVKARNTGMGWVAIRRTAHQGALYYYPLLAIQQEMVGIAMTTDGPVMVPWGGAKRSIGNNPIAFGVPSKTRHPLILDMAVSVVAAGWLAHARERGESIPEGWAVDAQGRPTSDPAEVFERGGALQPMGTYKGSGLSLLVEAMAGSGCRLVQIGIESGDRRLRLEYGKDLDDTTLEATFGECRRVGMKVGGHFVLDLPRESPATVLRTYRLASRLRPDYVSFNIATVRRGSTFARRGSSRLDPLPDRWMLAARNLMYLAYYSEPRWLLQVLREAHWKDWIDLAVSGAGLLRFLARPMAELRWLRRMRETGSDPSRREVA